MGGHHSILHVITHLEAYNIFILNQILFKTFVMEKVFLCLKHGINHSCLPWMNWKRTFHIQCMNENLSSWILRNILKTQTLKMLDLTIDIWVQTRGNLPNGLMERNGIVYLSKIKKLSYSRTIVHLFKSSKTSSRLFLWNQFYKLYWLYIHLFFIQDI